MIKPVLLILSCMLSVLQVPLVQDAKWKSKLEDEATYQQQNGPRKLDAEGDHLEWGLEQKDRCYLFTWRKSNGDTGYYKYCPKWLFSGSVRTKVSAIGNDELQYRYVVTNSGTSEQSILSFVLECPGLKDVTPVKVGDSTPIQMPYDKWHRFFWDWFCGKSLVRLQKGQTLDDIVMRSGGLPVISTAYLFGNGVDENLTDSAEDIPEFLEAFLPTIFDESKTVSVLAPSNTTPDLTKIQDYFTNAKSLNWISEAASVEIDQDIRAITASNCRVEDMNQMLQHLDLLRKDKEILDEAWGLLHFNVAWLIEHPLGPDHAAKLRPPYFSRPQLPIPLRPLE